jgi:tRNA A-37 threonylcarbamoyl transferase component Bud32
VPVQIAGYRIVRLIGAGGMGLVYEAVQEALQRRVALKLMQPGAVSSEALARFESEARALARLKHPGIAQVFDTGVYRPGAGGGDDSSIVPFLSMELIEGCFTLQEFADRAGVTIEDKLLVIADVCDALEHAHGEGVVHRDLKPSNILVNAAKVGARSRVGTAADTGTGTATASELEGSSIKIIDFGIAKVLGDGSRTITSRGQIVGTPTYMAPEQLIGGVVDDRTDVYSLGVILYQLCTGRLPLEMPRGLDRRGMEKALCEETPAPPRTLDRRLAGDLETIILKCLQKGPTERYQTVRDLRADLLAFLAGEPIRATRTGAIEGAWRAVGRIGGKRPLAAFVGCAAAALLIAMTIVFPAVYFWTGAGLWYANAVGFLTPASGMLSALPDVRMIVIDDETDFEAIAAKQGLNGVSNDNIRSARLIHAQILKSLAKADPRAVGLDIMFRGPTDFDAPLLGAIADLRKHGVGIVLASPTWAFGPDGLPPIAPEFAKAAWAGPPTGGFQGPEIWGMDIALERAGTEVIPGFSTLVFAACRAPDAEVAVSLREGVAEIRYFKPGTQRRAVVRGPDRLKYSGVQKLTEPDEERGLLPGDFLAVSIVPLPVTALENCTIPMQQFFAMSDADVRREFSGKAVLIGNASESGQDFQVSPTGVRVPGVWTHGAMVQQMLRDEIVDTPNMSVGWTVAGMMAAAGAAAGFGFARRWQGVVLTGTLTLIAVCVSVLMLRTGGMYWNPLPAIAAGWLGCGLAMMVTHDVRRLHAGRLGSV